MKAKPFLSLLAEANKLDVYNKRWQLSVSAYPYQDEDAQQNINNALLLPDDVLSDILDADKQDDISTIKEALNNGN